MSDAKSDQNEDESKENVSDDPEIQAKDEDSNHQSEEKSNNSEALENLENNSHKYDSESSEKTPKNEHGRGGAQSSSSDPNEPQNELKSPSNYHSIEKLESDPGCLGEYLEYSSLETGLRDFSAEDLSQPPNKDETYELSYKNESPDDTPRGHWGVEKQIVYNNTEDLKMEEEKHDKFDESQLTVQSSEQETPPLYPNVEKPDETSEFYLSDNQMSEQQSEPVIDGGFSDIDLPSEKGSKSKHRKRFKTTTKSIESLFHKSSIGKSSKSKTKGTSTSGKTPPKDKLLVTTSTSSVSKSSKKDKTPCWTNYEIPSKPVRKGPTLGVFYDSVKSSKTYQRTESGKDAKCIVLQTPDSLERYLHPFQVVSNYYVNQSYVKYYNSNVKDEEGLMSNYYYVNMMTQRKSLLPYYVTKTIFGNVPGMGRVLVCGTQCGKIIFQSFFTLDELIVLDTRSVYDRYLSRDNSIDSDSGLDINKAIDSTLFEVNCLAFINTFQSYSTLLAIGNHLGHLLVYQVPKLQLVKLIYPTNLTTTTIFNHSSKSRLSSSNSFGTYSTYSSMSSLNTDIDEVLIDELELLRIRRYKSTSNHNKEENRYAEEEEVVFITCLGYCSTTGDLWVGYGNATFAIYSNKFKLKYFYNSNTSGENSNSNIIVDNDNVYSVNNFEYCKQEQIVLVLFGNVKVDIFTFEGTFMSTINCTRLTNDTIPISTIHVSPNTNGSSILYIGLMDGSLLVKQIVYTKCSKTNHTKESQEKDKDEHEEIDEMVTSKIEFVLLYNLRHKFDCEDNFGAPVTSICPVPSQNLVLLGNASGGLSVISNLIT